MKILYLIACGTLIGHIICDGKCPPSSLLSAPCHFIADPNGCHIECKGGHDCNLTDIFRKLSLALNPNEKHFTKVYINTEAVSELSANVFADIQFTGIEINDNSLRRVHRLAFNGTTDTVEWLDIASTGIGGDGTEPGGEYDLFGAIGSLRALKELDIWYTHLTAISIHSNKMLENIYIDWNNGIKTIGGNDFYDLPALKKLQIKHNLLEYIDVNAFSGIDGPIDRTLTIRLKNNSLKEPGSFKPGFLAQVNRPIHLDITSERDIEYINETIFGPFIRHNPLNIIIFYAKCTDPRNVWISHNYPKQWIGCSE